MVFITTKTNAYDPASLHRYTYAQNNPQMYNDPSGHMIGLIGAATNLTCAQLIRSTCVTNMAGTLTGFVNGIINEMLGGEEDSGAAFVKGFLFGAVTMTGVALAFAGATAIRALFVISDAIDLLSLAREIVECVKSIVLAVVLAVTGCNTQAAIYVNFAVIYFMDILVTLGLSGMVIAKGPKGRVGIGVEGGSKVNFDNEIPRSGADWNEYLKGKYGADNVHWNINSVDDIFSDPTRLKGYTADEL